MSLFYFLFADADPAALRTIAHDILGAGVTESAAPDWTLHDGGLRLRLRPVSRQEWTVAEEFDVRPRSLAHLELDKFGDTIEQQMQVLRLGLQTVRSTTGDVVLLFNGDIAWLLRRQGELVLNRDLWDERRLTLVEEPYEMRTLPVP